MECVQSTDVTGIPEDNRKQVENGSDTSKKDAEKVEIGEICEDIILIQDTGFTVHISVPGLEPFELLVSSMELVQEIYQVLIDREDTCHRTCFSLQLDGATLDNFAELKNIEGLKDGSVIKVVEEPYTVREARIHTRHVRDLLKSLENIDGYNGVDCSSLSFLNAVTGGDLLEKKRGKHEQIDCTPPDYIMPGSKECPIFPLHPVNKDLKAPQCLKCICYSGWNPPPGNRKMHGDLLYLYIETLECKRYHVTASTKGFYLNQSTLDEFIPKPSTPEYLSHSLIDLLNQISPAFKRNFVVLLQKRTQMHPFERVATPYQVHSWLAPLVTHSVDTIRAEDAFSARLGYEEHIPGQTRDWNEELQTTRELNRKTLPERLLRERAVFKVHSDFVIAATRGAIAVIDGNIMAINPGEEAKMQMFLWNNIFFSLGFDVKDHYKDFGGDAAAYVAPSSDLQGVKAYLSVDAEGLYTLGTIVVDYRGYRVTAQSIIPGILEREQEQSVVYGSIDFGKTVVSSEKYKELLQKTASQLKIRPHKVINDKEEEVELFSSVECKGIVGNDNRYYILDLLRTFPPDVNYLDVCKDELSEELKRLGFPRKFKHKLVCLRQELVDAFVESRYVTFVKHAAFQFQQLRDKKLHNEVKEKEKKLENDENHLTTNKVVEIIEENKNTEDENSPTENEKQETMNGPDSNMPENADDEVGTEEAKMIVQELAGTNSTIFEENSNSIVTKAFRAVGSLSDTEFTIGFNTDVFQPHVRHVNPDGHNLRKEEKLVREASEFLVFHQIPTFINYCLDHTSSPIDGYTLTEALHHNGINIRYLGSVTQKLEKTQQLSYLYSICIVELITRATKHLFRSYIQGVDLMNLSAAISHFLNCFLGSFQTPRPQFTYGNPHPKSSKKRNNRRNKMMYLNSDNTAWTMQTPKTLWKNIAEDVSDYYYYQLDSDSIDQACDKYSVQKVSILRSFCKKVGLQILLKDYNLFDRHHSTFAEEDILNVFPVVKHIHPRASDAYNVFTTGQNKIQQGLLRDGYELISEALNLLNNVYGAMHPEIAACARLLARLNYIMGDYTEALVFQQRAVLMSERVLGVDHPNTITEYAHMALYCFANNQMSNALKLLYRARYLALVCHGENHPEIALFDSNIGLILQGVGEYDLSLKFLQKALELNTKFFGSKSLKVAMSHHLVARTYSCKGEFRAALQNEKQAYTIYKTQLGEEHDRAKESSECLKHLTQQAVKFQKTMNNIYKGEKNIRIPPIQIQTPSIANVLEILNLINGIVFVHISQEEINKFREEMMRRQHSANLAIANPLKCLESKESKLVQTGNEQENTVESDSPKEAHGNKEAILNNVNEYCATNEIIEGDR